MKKPSITFAAVLLFLSSLSLQAGITSVHFYTTTHTSPTDVISGADTAGAGTASTTGWNNINVTSGSSPVTGTNLPDATGTATTIDFSFNPNGGGANTSGAGGSTGTQKLFGSGREGSNNINYDATLAVTQIPYTTYNLYFYFNAGFADRKGSITVGGTTYYVQSSTVGTSYTKGTSTVTGVYTTSNYVVFTGLTGASQTVTFESQNGNSFVNNGFQLEEVSAPPATQIVSTHFYTTTHTSPTDVISGADTAGAATALTAGWNNVNVTGAASPITGTNLNNAQGTATTIDFSLNPNGGGANTSGAGGSTGTQKLFGSGREGSNNPNFDATLAVTQIPYSTYNLYFYFNAGFADRKGAVTVGGTTYYVQSSAVGTSYTKGTSTMSGVYTTSNYVVFTGLTGASQTVTFESQNGNSFVINGFQIEGSGSTPPVTDPDINLTGYTLTYADEFNGSTLNVLASGLSPIPAGSPAWIPHTPWNGDFGSAWLTDPNYSGGSPFSVSGGNLSIKAWKDANNQWRAGLLSSVDSAGNGFKQKYGYFAAKIKVPSGAGTWPAFWLAGHLSDPATEIDVMELYGKWPTTYHTNLHVWTGGNDLTPNNDHIISPGVDLSAAYHIYGVLVKPDYVTYYLDGVQVDQMVTPINLSPSAVLINYALGGADWDISGVPNPSYMLVDWVRVYSLPPGTPTNLALNKTAVSSSNEGGSTTAAQAVDGSASTRWSSAFSDPQWIYVDLGSTKNITEVKLSWEGAYGKSFQVQTSNDASTWTNIYSTTTGTGGLQNLTGLSGSGRYVRMYGTQRGTAYGYSLWEFEVYGN